MTGICQKMLFDNAARYLGLVFKTGASPLLIGRQSAFFFGILSLTSSLVAEVAHGDIWVMNPQAPHAEPLRPLRDIELSRVRGVAGVMWAVPLFKGQAALWNSYVSDTF